jgi:hypothetical protein
MSIEVGQYFQRGGLIDEGREISEMNAHAVLEFDGTLTPSNKRANTILAPSPVGLQNEFGESERPIHPHTTVTERAPIIPEKVSAWRVMEVYGVLVRKHKFDVAEGIPLTWRLPDRYRVTRSRDDISTTLGVSWIQSQFRNKFLFQN